MSRDLLRELQELRDRIDRLSDPNELFKKPCPFCGGTPHGEQIRGEVRIVCNSCGAMTDIYPGTSDATLAWNTRKEPTP